MPDIAWRDPAEAAVSLFWTARADQMAALADGGQAGGGARAGGHMNGVRDLVTSIFIEAGIEEKWVEYESYLPGYYRPRKRWDMAVRYKGVLVAALEFKSQVGSVGKNLNNRFEEALGTATDTWAAHAKLGAYGAVPPWLGYVFVLREDDETETPDRSVNALFPADPDFKGMSYSQRYQDTKKDDESGRVSYAEPLSTATGEAFRAAVRKRVDFVRAEADG